MFSSGGLRTKSREVVRYGHSTSDPVGTKTRLKYPLDGSGMQKKRIDSEDPTWLNIKILWDSSL